MHTVKTSTASVHDSQVFTELTHGEEQVIAGDSAYANQMRKTGCRQAGLIYLIHDKGTRAKPLSGRQRHRNRQKSSPRSKVEFPFRLVKPLWGHAAARFRGLAKTPRACICSSPSPISTKPERRSSRPPELARPNKKLPISRQLRPQWPFFPAFSHHVPNKNAGNNLSRHQG